MKKYEINLQGHTLNLLPCLMKTNVTANNMVFELNHRSPEGILKTLL
jgi:hypothetical protein